jgi:uncharacterized RDD family membrane protein YckC
VGHSLTAHVEPERDIGLQGHYAGIVTRLAAFAIDVFAIVSLFGLAGSIIEYLVSTLSGDNFMFSNIPITSVVLFVAWAFLYCAYPLAVGGRTLGMALVGLRVVQREGSDIDGRHAVLRVLAFPLSFAVLGFGFLLILIRRDRRALHDLIAKTAVVYAWDARAARLRFLAKRGPN